jgi:hypothetical protein
MMERAKQSPTSYRDGKVANRNVLGWARGTEKRRTNPKRSRRACKCEYGLQSWRGESAGVSKPPRERPRNDSQFFHRCTSGAPFARGRHAQPGTSPGGATSWAD